jgi:hypothetical protein
VPRLLFLWFLSVQDSTNMIFVSAHWRMIDGKRGWDWREECIVIGQRVPRRHGVFFIASLVVISIVPNQFNIIIV